MVYWGNRHLMSKKEINYEPYDDYLYTGLQGFVMRQNHKILSKGVAPKVNRKILEIGGAAKLHCSLVDLIGVEEYWVSDFREVFEERPNFESEVTKLSINNHIFDEDTDYQQLHKNGHRFSRIIISHVWEHVDDPEGSLLKWLDLLEDGGQLDIAIPCDPGWLWRLGQLVSMKKAGSLYKMTPKEIDLDMARQHVNPCQNLMKIMKYHSKPKIKFWPTFVPISDFNLFIFFRVTN